MKTFKDFSTEQIRAGLETVRTGLMSGDIGGDQFDMEITCGTAQCIGGWLGIALFGEHAYHKQIDLAVLETTSEINDQHNLHRLFFDYPKALRDRLQPSDGVEAITNWLDGNTENPWKLAVLSDGW